MMVTWLPMEAQAEAAISRGLAGIAITDHYNPDYPNPVHRTGQPTEAYHRAMEHLAEQYAGRLTIRLGAELGEAPMGFDRAEKLLASGPKLDFVIGSVHMAGKKFHHKDLYYIEKADEAYYDSIIDSYLEDVLRLARWGKFSVLGHLTLPLRYINENLGEELTFDGHFDRCREIFRALIESGCGIECNTNRGHQPLPDAPLLKLYREQGGEIITLGSDAHSAEYVGCCIRERQELLRQCGFRYFTTFEGGKPRFRKL